MTALPTIVLVHGAWSTPPIYDPFVAALRTAGYTVHCPLLPTCSSVEAKFVADVAVIRELVSSLVAAGNEVAVLMHSFGGAVGSSALSDLSAAHRTKQGRQGGVIQLVYLSGYMLPKGGSVVGIVKEAGFWHLWDQVLDINEDGSSFPKDPKNLLFAGVGEAEQEKSVKAMVRFPAEPLEALMMETPWKDIPTLYVRTDQDWCVPAAYQDIMLKRAQEDGVKVKEVRFNCGHAVFLTHTDELVAYVDKTLRDTADGH